jgi:putative solute:sodium symporter small subunit
MADLTERQKQAYWRYNVRLTTILLVIWFVVTYLVSGLWAGWLNQYSILGFPLGYYMAAQGWRSSSPRSPSTPTS